MLSQRSNREIRFILHESLPHHIAHVLQSVGYPITSNEAQGVSGWDDAMLIPWMAERSYIWVTKDDAARSVHRSAIQQARISVVWVRGMERRGGTTARNNVSAKDLHLMLTNKLDDIGETVSSARGPRYFLLFMSGKRPQIKPFTTIDDVSRQLSGSSPT